MNFSELLKTYRRENGYTQFDLAEIAGVDVSTIAKWELGRQRPRAVAEARILDLIRPRSGVDAQLRLIVETTPLLVSILDPDTKVLATSRGFADIAQTTPSALTGLYDIDSMDRISVAKYARWGGPRGAATQFANFKGSCLWPGSDMTNRLNYTAHVAFTTRRIRLDDGSMASFVSHEFLPADTPLRDFVGFD